ncbi:MAG: formate--tetrahydrofolate ligase, partial [Actinomycetota bacterium]|nr:formate--tetrahydrofolate ligase [Actinomycetota bacterium]
VSEVWAKGGDGGVELAEAVVKVCETKESEYAPLYAVEESIKEKIETIAMEVYGADGVDYTKAVKRGNKQC